MPVTASLLKTIMAEARPIIERQMNDAKLIAGFRDLVASNGGDWSALKALIKAHVEDEADDAGDGKRVRKILDKADSSTAYADMLGLTNMNEKNFSAAPASHDPETGEIIEQNPTVTPTATTPAASVGTCEDGAGSDPSPFYSSSVEVGRDASEARSLPAGSGSEEIPAPLSPIGAPPPPGAADKTGAASSLPVAPVAQSDDELKPNPHCQKAKRGEMCGFAYSMASCWRCADAKMRAKEAA